MQYCHSILKFFMQVYRSLFTVYIAIVLASVIYHFIVSAYVPALDSND